MMKKMMKAINFFYKNFGSTSKKTLDQSLKHAYNSDTYIFVKA